MLTAWTFNLTRTVMLKSAASLGAASYKSMGSSPVWQCHHPLHSPHAPQSSHQIMANQESVQFKTVDGLLLHGRLYLARQKGPAIVMTPGVRSACAYGLRPAGC